LYIRLKAKLRVSILKKINIIIWIVLLSFVYGSHAGSQQTGNNEAPGHSALKKLSPMKTPTFNGSRVIVRLKKNSPDKRQSKHKYHKYNELPKFRNHAVMQRLKRRTENRRANILQALKKNRRSFTKRSWIPFLRRNKKIQTPPLNSRSLWLADSIAVTVTKKELEELKNNPNVEEVVENSILSVSPITLGSDEFPDAGGELWNHSLIGLEAARELGLDGTGIRIGQLDTGINPDLPDLAGKLVAWVEFDWNGERINSQPHETHASGHGTHVASVIVGDATGIAPGAELIAALVLPGGYGTLEQVLAGMQWIIDPDGDPETDDGARIVNMSLGMRGTSQVLREAIINMIASGVLPVCAIGNSGPGTTYSPGNVPEALGVGTIDEDDGYLIFSSGGKACWGDLCITKPDITAPGEHILGLDQAGEYQTMSGTSLAAPHVAGAAALLMQYNPQLTISELKSFLLRSSHDLGMRNQRPDELYGWGRLDLEATTFFMDEYAQRFKSADLVLEDTAENFLGLKINRFLTFFSDGTDGFIADQSSHLSFMNTGESSIKTVGIGDLDGDGIQDLVISESTASEEGGFIISYCVFRSLNHAPFSGSKETWFSTVQT
jgi:subtilisin family serine protease